MQLFGKINLVLESEATMKKVNQILLWCSVIIFIVLLVLITCKSSAVQNIDDGIRNYVNAQQDTAWNIFFKNFTQSFDSSETIIWAIIAIILAEIMTDRNFDIQITLTILTTLILNRVIKDIVTRSRPSIHVLMHYSNYSFPSGHSSAATAVLGAFILLVWRVAKRQWVKILTTLLFIILIFLVGFSRIYVGAHYPSDVLGGWCLGIIIITFYQTLFNKTQRKK